MAHHSPKLGVDRFVDVVELHVGVDVTDHPARVADSDFVDRLGLVLGPADPVGATVGDGTSVGVAVGAAAMVGAGVGSVGCVAVSASLAQADANNATSRTAARVRGGFTAITPSSHPEPGYRHRESQATSEVAKP